MKEIFDKLDILEQQFKQQTDERNSAMKIIAKLHSRVLCLLCLILFLVLLIIMMICYHWQCIYWK